MPAIKRVYRFDKSLGDVIEVTPVASENSKRKAVQAKYPIHSETMAVNPEDVPQAQAVLQRSGVQTEYDGAGRPVLRSKGHRRAHARAMGFYDRNAGYGDPMPQNR